jgi:hypothetical protein
VGSSKSSGSRHCAPESGDSSAEALHDRGNTESKRTEVDAVYRDDKIRDTDSGHTVAFGIRHRL